MKGGGAGGGATTTAPLQPSSRRLSQPVARGSNGQSTAAAAVGAVLTVRRQAKDALAELERRRASTPVGEGVCRARSRGASSGGGSSRDRGQQQEVSEGDRCSRESRDGRFAATG